MMRAAPLAAVDPVPLLDYPLSREDRLAGHYFTAWHHDRWLNSRLRLSAPAEVKYFALELFFLSQKQSPVGTLPDDDVQLAALLMLDPLKWADLRRREWSPLYKWQPCNCEGERRLMHPVVLEMILDAMGRRDRHAKNAEVSAQRKRMDHLARNIVKAGGTKRQAADQDLLARLDHWLGTHCKGNRTVVVIRAALEAIAMADAEMERATNLME